MKRCLLVLIAAMLAASAVWCEEQHPDSLLRHASGAYERGEYTDCAASMIRLIESGFETANNCYFAAFCLARTRDNDRAFQYLERAIALDPKAQVDPAEDSDLVSLRDDPRWSMIVAKYRESRARFLATLNADLTRMYEEDQAARSVPLDSVDWAKVAPRDAERKRVTLSIVEAGGLKAAEDYYHAAMILQHGGDSTSYRMAHELALQCVLRDSTHVDASWLVAASKDRYLQSIGRPQWYGTQFTLVDGRWTLEPIDTTVVSDEERARWYVPPLRESMKRVEGMNKTNNSP